MGGEGVWVGSRPLPSPWTIKVILYLQMGYTLLVWATVACIGEGRGFGHAGRRERYERQEYLPTLPSHPITLDRKASGHTHTHTHPHTRQVRYKTKVVRMMDNGSQYPFLEETSSCNAREDVGSTEAWERRLVPNHKHWLSHR